MAKKQKLSVEGTMLKVEYPSIRKSLSVDVSAFSSEVRLEAMLHGFKQKYGDVESGGTPQEKFAMLQRVVEAHKAGNWDIGTRGDDGAIVVEAVARVNKSGKKLPAIQAELAKLDDEARKTRISEWRGNAKVKAEIAKIRAERAEAAAEESDDDEIEV